MRLPPLSDTRRGNGALILVVLIAMAIMLYLYFGSTGGSGGSGTSKPGSGGTTYMGQVQQTRKKGREEATAINTQQLSILIAQYRQENNGKLPKTPADMEGGAAFNDQWGHEMTFSFETSRDKTTVKYHSNGPDGEVGTEDDVVRVDVLPF
jgi:hypothetical protein